MFAAQNQARMVTAWASSWRSLRNGNNGLSSYHCRRHRLPGGFVAHLLDAKDPPHHNPVPLSVRTGPPDGGARRQRLLLLLRQKKRRRRIATAAGNP